MTRILHARTSLELLLLGSTTSHSHQGEHSCADTGEAVCQKRRTHRCAAEGGLPDVPDLVQPWHPVPERLVCAIQCTSRAADHGLDPAASACMHCHAVRRAQHMFLPVEENVKINMRRASSAPLYAVPAAHFRRLSHRMHVMQRRCGMHLLMHPERRPRWLLWPPG